MAARMGKDGLVCVDGTTTNPAYVDSWTLNATIDTADVTAYGSTNKAYISTLKSHTASISMTLDRSDAKQLALLQKFESTGSSTAVEVRMYDSTSYWRSYALATSMAVNSQVGDKVSVSVNFQGSSGLAYITT